MINLLGVLDILDIRILTYYLDNEILKIKVFKNVYYLINNIIYIILFWYLFSELVNYSVDLKYLQQKLEQLHTLSTLLKYSLELL